MSRKTKIWIDRSFILTVLAAITLLFQNCTRTSFNSKSQDEEQKVGGGGVDGKLYSSYGNCVPSKIGVVAAIVIADDFQSAWMVREACAQLAAPRAINVNRIQIAADDRQSVMFDGRAYTTHAFNDGTLLAPAAVVQYPAMLASYATRPVWRVAGVDYAVGVPSSTVLKNPASIAIAGVTVNAVARQVIVTGNNVVLDGYDFSLNGGWSVRVIGADNTRIVNSLFIETASQTEVPITTDTAATNLYVGYSTIDGGGATPSPMEGALIAMNGRGLVTEYCWLKNAPSNIFVFGGLGVGGGGSVTIRYNLVEDAGRAGGGGGAYIRTGSGAYNHIQIVFNTSRQTPGGTGTAGWNLEPPSSLTAEVGNNVMVTTAAGAASYLMSAGPNIAAAVMHNNYFDASGAFGFAYPGSSVFAAYDANFNMINGQAFPTDP